MSLDRRGIKPMLVSEKFDTERYPFQSASEYRDDVKKYIVNVWNLLRGEQFVDGDKGFDANLGDYHVFYVKIVSKKKDAKWNDTLDLVEAYLKSEKDTEYDAFKRNKGIFLIKMKAPPTKE